MQDHEARASDLNRKLISVLVLFAIFLIKATYCSSDLVRRCSQTAVY